MVGFGIEKVIFSTMLALIAYFLKKMYDRLDDVVKSVIALNLTMTSNSAKYDSIRNEVYALKDDFKEYKKLSYEELSKLRDFKHKHLNDAENLIRMYSESEAKINRVMEEVTEIKINQNK